MIPVMLRTLAAATLAATGVTAPLPPAATLPPPPPDATGQRQVEIRPGAETKEGRSWFVLPTLFWLPETKLGAAAAAGLHFHAPGASEASSAYLVAGVAIGGQATVDLSSDVWLASGASAFGRLRVANYPEAFYGVGPDTRVAQREDVTRRFAEATLGAELPVPCLAGRLRAGPRAQGRVEGIRDPTPGGLVATHAVDGAGGFSAVGLGGSVTWDTRDNKLWTTRGTFAEAAYLYYPASLGDNDGFGRFSGEARAFAPLGGGRVIGIAALLERASGHTPFSVLAKIGSTRFLRGIREGRFRDDVAWAAQSELRLPLYGPVSAAAFGALGNVAPSLSAMTLRDPKLAAGGGLRYALTREGATLRADVAVADSGPEVYVLLLEAF
jgi:hypothetical protein